MSNISENLIEIKKQIPDGIKVVAASKYVGTPGIREAYKYGVRDFGESRFKDAIEKISQLNDLSDITWHFIGHLQSNKVRNVLKAFNWIHSIDSLDLLNRVDLIAGELGVNTNVLLQVKLAEDMNKFGFTSQEILSSLDIINSVQNIWVRGLMTILPYGLSQTENIRLFNELRNLKDEIDKRKEVYNYKNINIQELSMGMSSDYIEAIKAGSTVVRLGRAVFS